MSYSTSSSDRLAAVRAAINAILTGAQEYWVAGRKVVRADLKTLYSLERDLQDEVNSEADGPSMSSLGVQVEVR